MSRFAKTKEQEALETKRAEEAEKKPHLAGSVHYGTPRAAMERVLSASQQAVKAVKGEAGKSCSLLSFLSKVV